MATMAHIRKRSGQWQARYRGPDGREHARTFARKVDADKWLDTARGQLSQGEWVDPASGRTTFKAYVAEWQRAQLVRESTSAQIASHVRAHLVPRWGQRQLASITRADVQAWIGELATREPPLSPVYVEGLYRRFSAIMRSAVDDRLIGSSPCRRIRLPEQEHRRVEPLPHESIAALAAQMTDRTRATVLLAAGSGLRQGEILGLAVDRVDFLRGTIRVDQQMSTIDGIGPVLRPPKTKASMRTVPVGRGVTDLLAAHLAEFPAVDGLTFTDARGRPWRRATFGLVFAAARDASDVRAGVRFHDLRHFYASMLIEAGEGPQIIKERLGHSSITETFDTYGHLFPKADDRTRDASDEAMRLISAAVKPRSAT